MAVEEAFGARTAWVSEIDSGACKVLAHRFPHAPNLGDITAIDWATVPPVDIITGGSPCFVAGTPVLTRRGLIPIEDVIKGDQVWTHEARWRPVTATMTRIAPTVEFRPGFYSTPDHRLWLRKQGRKWNNDRRAYDRVLGDPDWIDAEHSQGHYVATPVSVTGVDHDKPETLTWWQIGRFLADGYTNHQVNIYLGGTKLGDAERFPGWKRIQQETALKLTMPRSAAEAVWLSTHFGKGAHGKTLPAFVLALPEEGRREVLEGYWSGDGHAFGKRSMRSASVSPALTVGIQMLAASLCYSTSLHYNRTAPTTVIQGRTVNQRDWWSMTATPDEGRYTERDQDWLWQKLRKQPAQGPLQRVYDLTVADDHSFIAAGIVVHNCQDLSTAGRRAGMTDGARSNLWVAMREAIANVKPTFVVWENVRGALSAHAASDMESDPRLLGEHPAGQPVLRALGRVLGDLADLGYDAEWRGLRASDVGACHQRFRVFVLAWRRDAAPDADGSGRSESRRTEPVRAEHTAAEYRGADALNLLPTPSAYLADNGGTQHPDKRRAGGHSVQLHDVVEFLPTPAASVANDGEGAETWLARRERVKETANNGNGMGMPLTIAVQLLPTVTTTQRGTDANLDSREGARANLHNEVAERFGQYAPAIARQEQAFGYPAPSPTEPAAKPLNRHGNPRVNPRLSARFAEWMMGTPPGWITDTPGVTRNEALRMAGNGVVRQQALAALTDMQRFVPADSVAATNYGDPT